jgi:hypothetical protein
VKRMEKVGDYRPVNLPATYETWPMPVKAEAEVTAEEMTAEV